MQIKYIINILKKIYSYICIYRKNKIVKNVKMPMEFLDRLPIPNLRVYTTISFAVLSCSVYYAVQIIKDPAWKSNHTYVETESESANDIESDPRNLAMHLKELLECMLDEPICIWVSDIFRLIRLTKFVI